MKAIITERGNGFPGIGDYVAGDDGEVYRVVRCHSGRISTGQSGSGNSIRAEVELADWDDIDDEAEGDMTCSAQILADEDDDDNA